MSHLLSVKRLELYMDLALYKINILLLLLILHVDRSYGSHIMDDINKCNQSINQSINQLIKRLTINDASSVYDKWF